MLAMANIRSSNMQQLIATVTLLAFVVLGAYSQGFRVVKLQDYDYLTQLDIEGKIWVT